jgi:CRISPR-associated protein Csb1
MPHSVSRIDCKKELQMTDLTQFDSWLKDGGPAALVARELLEPVEGDDGVFFPATFAAAEDKSKFAGGYNIDVFPRAEEAIGNAAEIMIRDGKLRPTVDLFPTSPNICLVDSVGSQANRIEPLFEMPKYRHLVPQINVVIGQKKINLLRAGHRAGDALIRFTEAGEKIWDAFKALGSSGDAEPMEKIAPTSLLFGVWDSRGTQVKIPRAFRAVIRAHNVRKLTRSAQYNRATKFVEEGIIPEELDAGDGEKNPLSREGFKDSPATATHGGVIADGEIRREITINLSAIRRLRTAAAGAVLVNENDLKLRRYVLGLALVAATATTDELFDLREGCQLRQKPGTQVEWRIVPFRGEDTVIQTIREDDVMRFAESAAAAFGVGPSGEFEFDESTAVSWLSLKKEEQDKRRRSQPMTKQFSTGSVTSPPDSQVESTSTPRKNRKSR